MSMLKNDLLSDFSNQIKMLCFEDTQTELHFQVALSGGLDSMVLLHLFARLREQVASVQVCAHHIHHGLSDNAGDWRDFCQQACAALNIDFTCTHVNLQKKTRTSLEGLAREKRYASLVGAMSDNSYLVSAHHQDDQLETVLLALKRGSGNTGLQGIRSKQALTTGYLIRPLLNFSRAQLEKYACHYQLKWIEDESNTDQSFDRNFIRHTITPLLKNRWPAIARTVSRSASICQEQQQLLNEVAELDFSLCVYDPDDITVVNINALKSLSTARVNNVLRYWFKLNNLQYPSVKQLLSLWCDVVLATDNATPKIPFEGLMLRRYRECLYLVEEHSNIILGNPVVWQGQSKMSLLGGTINLNFSLSNENNHGLKISQNSLVEIYFRTQFSAKLTCTPIGRNGSRSIKKLLHEYNIPPWRRDTIPFVFINGELKQAVGLWLCETQPVDNGELFLTVSFD